VVQHNGRRDSRFSHNLRDQKLRFSVSDTDIQCDEHFRAKECGECNRRFVKHAEGSMRFTTTAESTIRALIAITLGADKGYDAAAYDSGDRDRKKSTHRSYRGLFPLDGSKIAGAPIDQRRLSSPEGMRDRAHCRPSVVRSRHSCLPQTRSRANGAPQSNDGPGRQIFIDHQYGRTNPISTFRSKTICLRVFVRLRDPVALAVLRTLDAHSDPACLAPPRRGSARQIFRILYCTYPRVQHSTYG
jgi:hypothetical protein